MRDSISLIANTGLQFYHFEVKFNKEDQKESKFRFIEKFDSSRKRFWLDEVILVSKDEDLWARKSELLKYNYITKNGSLSEEIDVANLEKYDSTEYFEIGNINRVLDVFEKKWIPLPYFSYNKIAEDKFGPTDWVRFYFERIDESTLKVVLLVDTTVSVDSDDTASPFLHENTNENIFSICENDELTISYLDKNFGCDWVETYINNIFNKPHFELEKPYLKPAATYVFLIRMLRRLSAFPQINLLHNNLGVIDVDLVVDIGNSKTCAILFENPVGQKFNFNSVKKLEMLNLSSPLVKYDDSFSTRVVFKESHFASDGCELNQHNKFIWPSPVRIGDEAEDIINNSNIELKLSRETRTSNSSPKRYLWDDKPSDLEWEFHIDDVNLPFKRVYKKGVSEQLNYDGSFCKDGIFGTEARFSRKSLMTFVYLELFSHALRQINSLEFRSGHGNPSFRRKIRRIVVSCPTGMIRSEQIALRQCAEEAIEIINNLKSYKISVAHGNKDIYDSEISIIPSVKDLSYTEDNLEQRKDWIYDEASAAQMVYLYGMIANKFNSNAQLFFDVFRNKFQKSNDLEKTLRIASLDIGGGTSDLLISNHELLNSQYSEIRSEPLYWESFKIAGDDLLEQIIQKVIIEGEPSSSDFVGCCGVIEQKLRKMGKSNVGALLNGFFGQDSNRIGYRSKLMRTNFINQLAMPIADEFLARANDVEDVVLTFSEIFKSREPSSELLDYFETHFGFRFENLNWKVSKDRLKEICEQVYSRLFRQIGLILKAYDCDILVLSGRPFSMNAMADLMKKCNHLPPNRQVNLNTFWIGRWYPFADDNGYVQDPKTIVCVGSLIALLGGSLLKLGDFRLDTELLKRSFNSSANYIGRLSNNLIENSILDLDVHEATFQITSLPYLLGYKKIHSINYPASALYSFQLNEDRIAEISRKKIADDFDKISDSAEDIKYRIRSKMPIKVTVSREFIENKEFLKIEGVTDVEGADISKAFFSLNPQTMQDPAGFWLDTGEFKLSTRS